MTDHPNAKGKVDVRIRSPQSCGSLSISYVSKFWTVLPRAGRFVRAPSYRTSVPYGARSRSDVDAPQVWTPMDAKCDGMQLLERTRFWVAIVREAVLQFLVTVLHYQCAREANVGYFGDTVGRSALRLQH